MHVTVLAEGLCSCSEFLTGPSPRQKKTVPSDQAVTGTQNAQSRVRMGGTRSTAQAPVSPQRSGPLALPERGWAVRGGPFLWCWGIQGKAAWKRGVKWAQGRGTFFIPVSQARELQEPNCIPSTVSPFKRGDDLLHLPNWATNPGRPEVRRALPESCRLLRSGGSGSNARTPEPGLWNSPSLPTR